MGELTGLYAVWYREFKVFTREKSRIVTSIINPILWLLLFGGGLGASISFGQVNYQTFIYPGMLVMVTLFGGVFFGAYIVWDKKIDFLKEVLVSPLRRTTIFFGKAMGGITDVMIQVTILFLLGPLFGLQYTVFSIVASFLAIFLLSIIVVSIGITIGSVMDSPEGFNLITTFMIFPLFFLSGALYPLNNLPSWLGTLTKINPLTYAVDALRGTILNMNIMNLFFDFSVLVGLAIVMVIVGTYAFKKMKL